MKSIQCCGMNKDWIFITWTE